MTRNRTGYRVYAAKDRSHNDADLRDLLTRLERATRQGCSPETLERLAERVDEQRARCVAVHGVSVY